MPTTVTSSIGTASRDYSTLQAWEDAAPANLVSDDKVWRGECYNDSEFAFSGFDTRGLFLDGVTTDSTRHFELTAAVGESFQDHAGVRSNPQTYDQSKGVGISHSGAYSTAIRSNSDFFRISRLQIRTTAGNGGPAIQIINFQETSFKDLICDVVGCNGSVAARDAAIMTGDSDILINCLVIARGAGSRAYTLSANETLVGCAAIKPSDVTDSTSVPAIRSIYGGQTVNSCAVFGFTDPCQAGLSGDYNATDAASGMPGGNSVHGVPYSQATPFIDADKDSLDLRAIAGSPLDGAGLLDATNAPFDISGFTRPASPTIGVWQVDATPAPAGAKLIFRNRLHV